MNKSLETEAESLKTNTKPTAPVKADTDKTEAAAKPKAPTAAAKPKASATKPETTPKANPARSTPQASRPKASTSSKVKAPVKSRLPKKQSAKDLLSIQDNDVPDLNTSTDYPIHPNRIWPD